MIELVPDEVLARIMSPAQARRLGELRAEHPDWTYTPDYVHGISGMLEVAIHQPGVRATIIIGLTASGGDAGLALVARLR